MENKFDVEYFRKHVFATVNGASPEAPNIWMSAALKTCLFPYGKTYERPKIEGRPVYTDKSWRYWYLTAGGDRKYIELGRAPEHDQRLILKALNIVAPHIVGAATHNDETAIIRQSTQPFVSTEIRINSLILSALATMGFVAEADNKGNNKWTQIDVYQQYRKMFDPEYAETGNANIDRMIPYDMFRIRLMAELVDTFNLINERENQDESTI